MTINYIHSHFVISYIILSAMQNETIILDSLDYIFQNLHRLHYLNVLILNFFRMSMKNYVAIDNLAV